MTHFAIDADNNITTYATSEQIPEGQERFTSEKELGALAANWPTDRLISLWNSFAGVAGFGADLKPIKKFTNRKTAIARIWKAIQKLDGVSEGAGTATAGAATAKAAKGAQKSAKVAPPKAKATMGARKATNAPKRVFEEGRRHRHAAAEGRRDPEGDCQGHRLAKPHNSGLRVRHTN
jgi:hypothetical protein